MSTDTATAQPMEESSQQPTSVPATPKVSVVPNAKEMGIEALPYVDEYNEDAKKLVESLVQEEIARDPKAAAASAEAVMKRIPEAVAFNSFVCKLFLNKLACSCKCLGKQYFRS